MPDTFARELTTVTLARTDQPRTVTAETTRNPHLLIAGAIRAEGDSVGLSSGYWVIHRPTGRTLPSGPHAYDLSGTREFVELIADHDWSFDDPGHLSSEAGQPLVQVVMQAQRAVGEVKPDPTDVDTPISLPKTAAGAVPEAVTRAQHAWTRWWNGDEQVPKQQLDTADGEPNHLYMALLMNALQAFDSAYLLAVLQRIDPQAADSASCWLAHQHESGDTVGEFLYEWTRQIEQGEPLHLPGAMTSDRPADIALTVPIGGEA